MTVDFALFLSPQGIALAHRQIEGHWALVGEVAFESSDLAADMAGLRATATARGAAAAAPVLLILPDDQILYTSFMAPVQDAALVEARILEGLDGLTPYAVADLVHDWRPIEADRVKVAVIAQETLDEAAAFAAEHGFESAGFAAMPPAEKFPGMPMFTKLDDAGFDGAAGFAFGPDTWVDPALNPPQTGEETPAADESAVTPEPIAEDAAAPATADVAPSDEVAAPELALTAPDPARETPAVEPVVDTLPEPAPVTEAEAAPEAAPSPEPRVTDDESGSVVAADTPDADAPMGLAAILDLTLDRPIAAIQQDAEKDLGPEPETTAQAEPPAPPGTAPTDSAAEPISAPIAARGKVARPSAIARSLSAEKPEAVAPSAPKLSFRPPSAAAGVVAPSTTGTDPQDAGDAPSEEGVPLSGFSARRGRAPKPEAEADAGALVSSRRPRLGFGALSTEDRGGALHPDVGPGAKPAEPVARPGSMLAAQLARVRDASKARPKIEATPSKPSNPDDTATPRDAGAAAPVKRGVAGMFRRAANPDAADVAVPFNAPESATPPAQPRRAKAADAAFADGLLARKSATTAGPTLRTGLVLTLVLLVLLALIAIWSALYLPDSPIARMFGGSTSQATEDVAAPAPDAAPAASSTESAMVDLAALDPEALADGDVVEDIPVAAAPPVASAPPPSVAALPDIDADLDLPPLPPLPQDALPSVEETERIYAEDGIWPRPPDRPFFSPFVISDDIYIASIDPEVTAFDAVALADPRIDIAETLRSVPPPPGFGAQLARDARGLITPTPEGVLTPEGAFVVLGRPPLVSQPRPREIVPAVAEVASIDVQDAILSTLQPRPRPSDLVESRERQVLGGLTVSELAGRRPSERPASAQETAASASLFPQAGEAATAEPSTDATVTAAVTGGTERAIAASRVPSLRPANFASIVADAQTAPEQVVAVAATAIAPPPSIPSNADVSRAATARNEIRLRDINLIGVTGTPSNRSALVRLSSGRFVRVNVGDRLDGGRVAAIGETTLQYVINGRNVTLEIPG